MLRRLGAASVALLALFHLWLFAGQIWDGELAEPARLSRWAVAAGLVAALVWLRRRGVSLWRGRPAVAVWLIAALLHAPAIGGVATAEVGVPEVVATLAPIAAAAVAVALIVLIAGPRRRRSAPAVARAAISLDLPPRAALVSLLVLAAPRPPPHSL